MGREPVTSPGWSPPDLRHPVTLGDEALARQALELMGSAAVGAEGSCRSCHALGRPTLTHWLELTRGFTAACLGDTALESEARVAEMVDCFSGVPAPDAGFEPATFGIYSAAAHLPWFQFLFEHSGEPDDGWRARHEEFVGRVGMPRAGALWSQAQFDTVAEWFARGLPEMFELVPDEAGEDCTPGIDPALVAHVEETAVSGWRARNEQMPLLMLGCTGAQSGADCLSDLPLAQDETFGESWSALDGASLRVLFDNGDVRTNYWSRASADGRYIASGLRFGSRAGNLGQFVDLQSGRVIEADFSFDPTFFPDNSGFLLQRGGFSAAAGSGPTDGSANRDDVAILCNQSLLGDPPDVITGEEPECTQLEGQIGLYQQLAKSLDGDDYWVAFGAYGGDDGGPAAVTENPQAAFESQSTTTLVPMINTGAGYEAGAPTRVLTPLQGDPMLSPSGRLLVTRVKGRETTKQVNGTRVIEAEQSGYALHLLTTARGSGGLTASLKDVGRICLQGGKAVVSYDERWLVLHHYVTDEDAGPLGFDGPEDPAFAPYRELGASNLYLVDLLDGSSRRITDMGAGQYALFPHFRSDGWIYFVVRTLGEGEWFVATDAALLAEAE